MAPKPVCKDQICSTLLFIVPLCSTLFHPILKSSSLPRHVASIAMGSRTLILAPPTCFSCANVTRAANNCARAGRLEHHARLCLTAPLCLHAMFTHAHTHTRTHTHTHTYTHTHAHSHTHTHTHTHTYHTHARARTHTHTHAHTHTHTQTHKHHRCCTNTYTPPGTHFSPSSSKR
jgi:hypothetical protein